MPLDDSRALDARAPSNASATSSSTFPPPWSAWLSTRNAELAREGVDRALRPVTPTRDAARHLARRDTVERWRANVTDLGDSCDDAGPSVRVRAFGGNDYLGMSSHARCRAAAARAAKSHGCGPRSSALVCGYTNAHRALERSLAALCETEECVLFPSGYAANATTLAATCGSRECAIFSDALNHASIVDGCRMAKASGASVFVFPHRDYDALERALRRCEAPRRVVVSDSLFSVDGDYADVERLARMKRDHGFLLVLDEAHATLVCGSRGGGVAQRHGACADVDVHVGTLSKAVGAHGGFVACSREMKRFLVSRARGQIFSTALPAPIVAAAVESLRVVASTPSIRENLWRNVARFNAALRKKPRLAATTRPLESPIGVFILGAPDAALRASAELLHRGFHVPAIRPPTVPEGASRLRVTLSAAHRAADVDALVDALDDVIAGIATTTTTTRSKL